MDSMTEMRHIMVLIDDVQAGDLSERADHPVIVTAGKTMATQLSIIMHNQDLGLSTCGGAVEEDLTQESEGEARTRIVGRVYRGGRPRFLEPNKFHPSGVTSLQVLVVAESVPLLLCYSFDGKKDLRTPNKGDMLRAEGKLYCEPSFAYGSFYSPVMADIIESKVLPREESTRAVQDWGIARLRLRTCVCEFDIVGYDLKADSVFIRLSDYNPPYSFWKDYLKDVHGWRWRREWKKSVEEV
jgi:hypothetical protein